MPENIEEIKSCIKERKSLDFCVVYDFLAHEKLISRCFANTCPAHNSNYLENDKKSNFQKQRLGEVQKARVNKIY
jgi:hypothetical protein